MKFTIQSSLLIFIAFLTSFCASAQEGKVLDKVVGVVGGNIILLSEVEAQYQQFVESGSPVSENTKCDLYEDLLYQKLLLNQSKLDSLEVGDAQVQAEIDRRLRYFIVQFGSEKKLEDFYDKSILEIKEEFYDPVKDQLLIQMMEGKVTEGISVTPGEVKEFYNSIPTDSLPYINSQVEFAHIVKKPPISEKEKMAAKTKVEGFRTRILNGESFETLAILYSEDPGSAKNGGELGYTPRTAFVPEFSTAAFGLKDGEISTIVETEYGFHVLQMIGRRGDEVNVRHILISPKVNPMDLVKASSYLDSIKTVIESVDTLTFELGAKLFSDDDDTKENGGRVLNYLKGNTKFEMNEIGQMDPTLTFVIDKMEPGDISTPALTTLNDGTQAYRLVKLRNRTKPHVANLTDDYQQMQDMAVMRKQGERLETWINKRNQKTFIRIADEYAGCKFQNNWPVKLAEQ